MPRIWCTGPFKFLHKHLAAEVASVATKLLLYLTGMVHLSLSFDGWSSKGHDEIYTVHVTTPLRRSFLFDALVLTSFSTSGESLFNFLSEVCAIVSYYVKPS
jgi:hypothetical protein